MGVFEMVAIIVTVSVLGGIITEWLSLSESDHEDYASPSSGLKNKLKTR